MSITIAHTRALRVAMRIFSRRGNDSPQSEERFRRFDNTDLLSKNDGGNDSTQCNRHSWLDFSLVQPDTPIGIFDGRYYDAL